MTVQHSGEDESSEEWEVASPRSTRKSPNGNIDTSSPSHQGARSYSSAAQTSPSIDQVVGTSRAAQQANPVVGSQPRSPVSTPSSLTRASDDVQTDLFPMTAPRERW